MWAEFWFALLVGVIFIFAPAYGLLRIFKLSPIASAACAPILSLLFYSLLAIAYGKLGIWTNGWSLFMPLCVVFAITGAVSVARMRKKKQDDVIKSGTCSQLCQVHRQEWGLILLYVVVGVVVGCYVFLGSLGTPDSTSYNYDDQSHLGYIRSFVERGNYSSIDASYEYDLGIVGGYYPAAWHLLAASVVTMCGVVNYVGANVALFISCALIFPLCCLFFLRVVLRDRLALQITGAFLTLVSASFPWEFIYYGRLTANLLAFCLVPAMMACTLLIFRQGANRPDRIRYALVLFASFILSLFTQPSVCFTWLFFSVPFMMCLIWNLGSKDRSRVSVKRRLMRVSLFCLGVFIFLIICYMLPFLYSLTRFKWPAPMSVTDAIANIVLQGNPAEYYSPVLAILVALGIVFALKRSETRWLVILFAMLAVMYVVDAGTNLKLKNYMTGWWYTDSHRVLAMFAIASYPLAVLGLGVPLSKLTSRIQYQGVQALCQIVLSGMVAALALVPTYGVGQVQFMSGIGYAQGSTQGVYDTEKPDDAALLSAPERRFVQKATEITGDDLVFNIPKDGSAFAYQSAGMRTYMRWVDEGVSGNPSTRLIQRGLDDIATNSSVRRAADALGIKYVMMLDQGHEPFHAFWGDYSDSNWKGVLDINEDTPGFELVLSDGDMKLYRILSEDETKRQMENV